MHAVFLLSGILVHGYIPDDLSVSTIIPIPKGKNQNVTDSTNYRGIALSLIFCKIGNLIILDLYSDKLITSALEFGFKQKRSTNMWCDS